VVITLEWIFPNSHKDNQNIKYDVINESLNRYESLLVTLSVVSIMLVFLLHLTAVTVQFVSGSIFEEFVKLITTITLILL
jgi:hypothetical protein